MKNIVLSGNEVENRKSQLGVQNSYFVTKRGSDVANYKNMHISGLLGFKQDYVNRCMVIAANRANLYLADPNNSLIAFITVGMNEEGIIYGMMLDNDPSLIAALVSHIFQIKRSNSFSRAWLVTYTAKDLTKSSILLEEAIISFKTIGTVSQISFRMDYHHQSYTYDARFNYIKLLSPEDHRAYHRKYGQGSHQIIKILG